MVTITGADTYFTNVDTDITQTQWESIIDQAVDKINGYARDDLISNMAGTAGSKSLSVTSAQAGFIRSLAVLVYQKEYKSAGAQSESYNMGILSHSRSAASGSGGALEELAEKAANRLKEIEVSYG